MTLRRCTACGSYTLEEVCPSCDGATQRAGPARYSPEDRYGTYRRTLRKQASKEARTD